jgi:ribonuclease E
MQEKVMLINAAEGQECRIAIVRNGVLEELYVERTSSASRVGNIYKARVTNVEPAIQAAFVDFGAGKNGFLHISDLHTQFFPKGKAVSEPVGRKQRHRDRPPIQDCLRRGQEVVVQLTKDGIGTKGPTMTTYLSVPGKLLVMMPGMSRVGVSRKIEDEEARKKAREVLADLSLPQDMGFIVRTAGMNRSKRDLQRDLHYLLRLWKSVKQRIKTSKPPAEIYQESDLVTRTIRDVYDTDIARIICDSKPVAMKVKEFLDVAMPRAKHVIELYVGKSGLFHDYGLEEEIEKINSRRVELPLGGSLVIDQTEALVAVDVNSGRFREHTDAETTALQTNLEAAKEIARQLRLRDLGGVIIIDFIDMRQEKNCRAVEKAFREAIKVDRAKTKVLRISSFGIVEMTRQRVRPSLQDSIYRTCWHCQGSGMIKSEESLALLVLRSLQRAGANPAVANIKVAVAPPVAHHLSNYQRGQIVELESQTGKGVIIEADPALVGDQVRVTCTNSRGSEVALEQEVSAASKALSLEKVLDSVASAGESRAQAGSPSGQVPQQSPAKQAAAAPSESQPQAAPAQPSGRRRRGRRRRKGHGQGQLPTQTPAAAAPQPAPPQRPFDSPTPQAQQPAPEPAAVLAEVAQRQAAVAAASAPPPAGQAPKRRRRRRRSRKHPASQQPGGVEAPPPEAPAPVPHLQGQP